VEKMGTHLSHSPVEGKLCPSPPVPLRVRQDKPTAGADSMGAEVHYSTGPVVPYLATRHTIDILG